MPRQSMPVKQAERIAQKLADEMQVEFIDVELVKEATGRFLRFFIETPDGITLEQLEAYHRKLQPMVEDVDYDFMEVSSPGVDRPIKSERDFERAQGIRVELKTYKPVMGAKLFTGDLVGLVDGQVVITNDAGETLQFDRKDVALVKPVVEFDEADLQDDIEVE